MRSSMYATAVRADNVKTAGYRVAADGTFPTAKRLVPQILDDCPVKTIRAFYRKAWRYMDAYR